MIGIDIGGSNIKGGIVKDGEIIKKLIVPSREEKKPMLNTVKKTIRSLHSRGEPIGIGCPGPFRDIERGILGRLNNLPLDNMNLKKELRKDFKCRISMNNDANCFVLAEALYGAGKRYRRVAGITLGTGIGSGLVIDGDIYTGRSNALEFGHTVIDRGKTVEELIGKKAIKKMTGDEPLQLFLKAQKGNKKAIRAWEKIGRILGIALANLCHTIDPDVIVIGGQVSKAWKFFSKQMKTSMKEHMKFKSCKVVKSTIEEPGIIGASLLK